jgi:hypothetical protein
VIYRFVVIFGILLSGQARASEVLEDIIDDLCSGCGLGEILNDTRNELRTSVPFYSEAEDLLVASIGIFTHEYTERAAPLLCAMIRVSRDRVVEAGTQPIPSEIYARFHSVFGQDLLNDVEYRIGQDDELSIQAMLFPLGADAITLDHVIVFSSRADAEDPWMWAHELEHVKQVRRYGLDGFCKAYLQDFLSLEEDADEVADHLATQRRTVTAGSLD